MAQYNNELYHTGVLGMHWGHRKGTSSNEKKSINKKANPLIRIQASTAYKMTEALNKNPNKIREKQDNLGLKFNTKGMTETNKKLYALNYYSDQKIASKHFLDKSNIEKQKLLNNDFDRGERFVANLFGSDLLNKSIDLQLKTATEANTHYSKKVDDMLKEIGDMKISLTTVPSYRTVTNGDTVTSWNGTKYVIKDK